LLWSAWSIWQSRCPVRLPPRLPRPPRAFASTALRARTDRRCGRCDRGWRRRRSGSPITSGIVISRVALVESGWTSRQYLDDRVGRRLISGGDVEISLRLGSTGRQLWFTPDCLIWHLIPPQRTTVRSLAAMNRGLGTSQVLTDAMKVSAEGWFGALVRQVMAEWARMPTAAMRAFRGYPSELSCFHGPTALDLMLCTCFLWGKVEGLACLARMGLAGGPPFIGCAWPRSVAPPG
jgi:hypothetical protein